MAAPSSSIIIIISDDEEGGESRPQKPIGKTHFGLKCNMIQDMLGLSPLITKKSFCISEKLF